MKIRGIISMNHFFHKAAVSVSVAVCFLAGTSAFAAADMIEINGVAAQIPTDMGAIRELDDRTFVPVRFVSEYLGCKVGYSEESKMAMIESPTAIYLIQEGNSILFKIPLGSSESTNTQMDTAAFINTDEGRMYVPIRFLAEAMGYDVGWDEATETVTLNSK